MEKRRYEKIWSYLILSIHLLVFNFSQFSDRRLKSAIDPVVPISNRTAEKKLAQEAGLSRRKVMCNSLSDSNNGGLQPFLTTGNQPPQ